MSLAGQTAWVVGGVGVVGRGIARGLLKAGATVVVNSRSEERLERIQNELENPERLIAVHGSLLPDNGAAQTVDDTLAKHGQVQHVVAHGAVRYWTTKRAACDETYSLAKASPSDFLSLSAPDFRMQSSQLASLHYSAIQQLMPRLVGSEGGSGSGTSYTFVTGDGSGHPSTLRSAMGEINSHQVWGLAAAVRQALKQQQPGDSPLCREIRIGLPVNRSKEDRKAAPRDRPLSEDIGDLCAGLAASAASLEELEAEQGKFIRIETLEGLNDMLIQYHADADKDIGPMPSFAEFVGSL
mmetsp:Transcript_34735/g.72297  ORF Transcript_34735/g.72297 Transcript_34735/m.72297 type:complete len:297 (-) Transcript_34735:133-1023(-)